MRRDGAANRERILLAAERVFGAGGEAASTEEVAREAQVGVATVFRHFPTKQDLIEATALRYLGTLQEEIVRQSADPDTRTATATVLRTLVATGPTKVTLLTLLLADGESLSEPVMTTVRSVRGTVAELLARAQDAGTLRADLAPADFFTLARALAHVAAPDDDAPGRAVDVVLDGLRVLR